MIRIYIKRAVACIMLAVSFLAFIGCNLFNSSNTEALITPYPRDSSGYPADSGLTSIHTTPAADYVTVSSDRADLVFENAVSHDANTVAATIDEYINTLDEVLLTALPHVTVNVVANEGVMDAEAGGITVSHSALRSRDFAVLLAKTVEGLPEWVYRGAAFMATDKVNIFKLSVLYTGEDADISALSLTPARFAARYNDESELRRNYHTASAFLQYIIDKYGYIKTNGLLEDKRDFLRLLAEGLVYDCPYEGAFDAFTFTYDVYNNKADEIFPLCITTNFCKLYAQPLMDCPDAKALEEFLYKLIIDRQYIKNFVEENSEEYLYICDFGVYTEYWLLNTLDNSYAWRGHVVLSFRVSAALHETVHQWLMPNMYDHWFFEGVAEYLALQAGEGTDITFVNSMARHALQYPDLYGGLGVADLNNTPAAHRVEGDHLTYDQSCSMVAYIVETYSLDPVLALCGGYDYETALGFPFAQLYDEWVAWLGA